MAQMTSKQMCEMFFKAGTLIGLHSFRSIGEFPKKQFIVSWHHQNGTVEHGPGYGEWKYIPNPETPEHDCGYKRGSPICRECDLNTIIELTKRGGLAS